MAKITWDDIGQKTYELGVDHGVLYVNEDGAYPNGVAWNGLVNVNESPSGAESNAQYADNIKYADITSAEEFAGTIEAFTYPKEFESCDGSAELSPGVVIGQQNRKMFGLSFRTMIGNDTDGDEHGYKLHLVYGAKAAPSEKAYGTKNDSPEPITFSWEFNTTPVPVSGMKPTSTVVIDSRTADPTKLAELEKILYGDTAAEARLPLPDEIKTLFAEA